jgi:hypothetical protein
MEITREQYKEILEKQAAGEITLYNDPASCRKFFSEADNQKIEEIIGESIQKEKFVINSLLVLEVLSLLLALIASIFVLKWFALLFVPVLILSFIAIKTSASAGRQSISFPLLFVIVGFLTAFSNPGQGLWFIILVISLPATYFFSKLLYYLSSRFAFMLLHRNYEFFKLVYQKPDSAQIPMVWSE